MTDQPDTTLGFDGTDGDVSVIVMHRTPAGTWQIDSSEGPHATELAEQFTAALPPPPVCPAGPGWADLIQQWVHEHGGFTCTLDDEQRDARDRAHRHIALRPSPATP